MYGKMVDAVTQRLTDLAATCPAVAASLVNGWSVDEWNVTDVPIALVLDLYRAVLVPPAIDNRIREMLKADGVDMDLLLLDEDRALDVITRADLAELMAAASLL